MRLNKYLGPGLHHFIGLLISPLAPLLLLGEPLCAAVTSLYLAVSFSDKSARILVHVRLVENETDRTYTAAERRLTKRVGS